MKIPAGVYVCGSMRGYLDYDTEQVKWHDQESSQKQPDPSPSPSATKTAQSIIILHGRAGRRNNCSDN